MADGSPFERRAELRESAIFKQKISERTGEREEIHKKTFLKWMNSKLARAVPPLEVTDLIEEVRDGHVLLSLLEVLLNSTLKREKGQMRVHKLNNVTTALKLLEQNRVKLVGISNYDIVDGKSTPILGLIWSIILRFQVQEVMEEENTDTSLKDYQIEKKLLSWCHTSLEGYEDVVKLKDFTSSWRDGLAFNAIIHSHKPELFKFESLLDNDNRTNLHHAFRLAHDEFAVPKLLDPADIDVAKPDKKLIIMYMTSLYHGLRGYTPQGRRKRRKLDDLGDVEEYRASLKEINLYITKQENDISSKLETTNRFANPQEEYKKSKVLLDDILNHRVDVEHVTSKGEAIVNSGKADEIQCTEIKNELSQLHHRWEKLNILAMRLNKRCRGAVISPREQQVDVCITWIRQIKFAMRSREISTTAEGAMKQIDQHKEILEAIQRKEPEINRVIDEVNNICDDPNVEDEDRLSLQTMVKDLCASWDEMKIEAFQKQENLQEQLSHASSDESKEIAQTEVLVSVDQNGLESAPEEISTLEIQPSMQYVVNLEPSVDNLIDFEDGAGPGNDQVDSPDREDEKDSKISLGKEKRDAVVVLLESCSMKLESLKSRGAPMNLDDVKEQQKIVQECDAELKSGHPHLRDAILYGRELTQDDLFDDNEKDNIARGMAQLQQHYDDLTNIVDEELESLNDLHAELEKRNEIRDWKAERNNVADKLQECSSKLRRLQSPAIEQTNEDLLAAAKDCSDEINALEPEVIDVKNKGNSFIGRGPLSALEEENISKDIRDIESSYNQLQRDGADEITRLEGLLLEQQSQDKKNAERINQWKTSSDKLNSKYKKINGKFTKVKGRGIPKEPNKVKEQLAIARECSSDILEFVPEIHEAFEFGNDLRRDKSVKADSREVIESEIHEIDEGFKNLKSDIEDFEKQLEDLSIQQEKEQSTKIETWETWVVQIKELLSRFQTKMATLKSQGEPLNRKDLDEQILLEKECKEELESATPTVREGLDYGKRLLDDDVIDEQNKAAIRKDREQLLLALEALERDSDDECGRLEVLAFQYDTDKKEKLSKWETWKIKLKAIIVMRQDSLAKLKSHESPGPLRNVEEQLAVAEECEEELLASEPEIKFALDYGEQLLDDDLADPEEQKRIQEDIDELERVLNELKQGTTAEKTRLHALYIQQNKVKDEKLQKWKAWKIRMQELPALFQEKMDQLKSKGEPQDKAAVEEQILLANDCKEELESSKPEMNEGLSFGWRLIEDDSIDDENKANIRQDLHEVEGTLSKQEQDVNDQQRRLDESLRFIEEHSEEGKMNTWKLWVVRIRELIGPGYDKLANLRSKGDPQIRKQAEEQVILTKEFTEQLLSSKPEISDGLGFGWLLLEDDVISNSNKGVIKQDLRQLEEDLMKLEQAKADEERRLEWLLLLRDGKEEEQKLKRWGLWIFRINHLIGTCELKLQDLKSKGEPRDKREVEEQVNLTKECYQELQSSKPEISDGLAYGWLLIEDHGIDDTNKAVVKTQLNVLEEKVLRLQQANAAEQSRLEWLALLYQGKESEQKLKKWELWFARIQDLINQSEVNLTALKCKGDPKQKEDIEEQMILTKKFNDELEASKPQIGDGLAYGRVLTEDESIDGDSRAVIEHDINQLEERLLELGQANDKEKQRMEWLSLLLQGKDKEQKIKRWEIWTIRIRELLSKCNEKLEDLRSGGAPTDHTEAEEQAVLENEFRQELESSKPEITAGLGYGSLLLEDDVIDDDSKASIRQEIKLVEEHVLRLEQAFGIENSSVVTLNEGLEAVNEDTGVIKDWREKFSILKTGFDAADNKIEQGKEAQSAEQIESCYQMLKDLTSRLARSEPELMKTFGYGKALAVDESLRFDHREEVAEDVKYLEERWKMLLKQSQDEYARLGVQLGTSQAKQRNLATWYEQCDEVQEWVNDKYKSLRSRPSSPESSFGGIKRQQSVIEDLVKELVNKQAEVNGIIDEGNEIIDDEFLHSDERKKVHDKMQILHDNWNKLASLASGKQQSVQVLLLEMEQQHLDKTQHWRRKLQPLMRWIASAEAKLNSQFAIAPDLDTVKKQKAELEDFSNEMLSHQREVSDALQTGDKLLKDSELPEDDRTGIQKEVLDLSNRWENLEELVTWKSDRIDDTIKKLKIQQDDKLEKWQVGLEDVNGWVARTSVKVESYTRLATDVDAALEQMDAFQEVIKDAPSYQEKVTNLNEFSSNLVTDPCLGEEERTTVRHETAICNETWNELVNLANARQARMEENLDKLERQQQDALERWRIRSERAGLALDKLEGQISIINDPIGTNLETIRRQGDTFEVFSGEVELNTAQMIDTFALGEKVRKDPKLTKKIKEDVEEHLNSLAARWDRVKDFLALRQERLDEASKRLQRDRRNKLQDWEDRLSDFDSFLRKAERQAERIESVGDDLETVRRQREEYQSSLNALLGQQRKVYDFGKFTDDLLADSAIDEKSKRGMRDDKEKRMERWKRIIDKLNNHQTQLQDKLSSLEKSEEEMDKLEKQLAAIQEDLAKVESICEQEIAPDFETLEKQKTESKDLQHDVQRLDSRIVEFLKKSDDLIDEFELPEGDQRRIERECDSLGKRWNKVKAEADTREPRIAEQYVSLEQRQRDLLNQWKVTSDGTLKWIADTTARVQSQDTAAIDLDHARAQRQEVEDIMKEIKLYEKQMDKLDQLRVKVVNDPSLRKLEKTLVINEKASISSRWESLLSNAEFVRDRLDGHINQLEKEQHEKLRTWKIKTEPLENWLVRNEAVVESYEPIGYDINNVRRQSEDAQTIINELLQEQPKVAEMTDFGNQLTTEPYVGLEERVRLQNDMQSLHERWDGLYESATTRHDRIQDRLKILEEEQRKLEEERKRLEEEEKRRKLEEERRRQEEAERRRVQEEERIRREEEERRRREEEQRKRREEEQRKQKEEEERRQREKEEERRRQEEEKRKRREEEEARRLEEEERKRRDEERKRKEEEERKRREEERRRKQREEEQQREAARRRLEEEERRKAAELKRLKEEEEERKKRELEEEEKRKREEEEEKQKAELYISPEPRVQLVQQEPRLFSSPEEEILLSTAENGLEAAPEHFSEGEKACEEKLAAWKEDVNDINRLLEEQEEKLQKDSDKDIVPIQEQETQILSLEKELQANEGKFHDAERDFGELMGDPYIKEDQQETIGEAMDNLRGRWRSLQSTKEAKKKRLKNRIWEEEQKKASQLSDCRVNLVAVKEWVELRDNELESMDPLGNDLDTLARQKEEIRNLTKRLSDYDPRLSEATDLAFKLSDDPAFSKEQKEDLRQDAETCEQRWDDVLDKARDRMDSILRKIPELQEQQKLMIEDWNDKCLRFEKSLKKTEETLKDQISVGKEIGYEKRSSDPRSPELLKRAEENRNNVWKPTVDKSNERLKRLRERLQDIQRDKKNRRWSIIEALKDVVQSISSRFRRDSKPGFQLDKVIELLEEHEDIMSETSSKQKDADEVFAFGANALESGMLEVGQANDIHERMTALGRRWDKLNVEVVEREERLEQLAQDIESEYEKFDSWREHCENMNQWLIESERLIRNEEKVGAEVAVLQEQISDNRLFLNEVKVYEAKVEGVIDESQEIVDRNKLDKGDIDGVYKTKKALIERWDAVKVHLEERQDKLESSLLDILKIATDNRVGRWKDQSVALGVLIADAQKKIDSGVDDTHFGDIQASATRLQEVETSLCDDFSKEFIDVTDSGRQIMDNEALDAHGNDEISATLDDLNRQISDLERGTRERKDVIKEASLKYFGRSLADCEQAMDRLSQSSTRHFSEIGSDIEEVGRQLIQLQDYEADVVKEEARFSDIKTEFADSEGTGILRDEDRARIKRRTGSLDQKWAELNKVHDESKRKLVQAMTVYHEELIEEVYDWMGDSEKQADSIVVDEDDIGSVVNEYGRHKKKKEEITSFEPTFKKALALSDRLLTEKLVDPERAETYVEEISSLEKRWDKLKLKTMDNGAKLSASLGLYLTTRLDEAELKLTHIEDHLNRDSTDYLDLEAAKRAFDTYKVNMNEIAVWRHSVGEIVAETRAIMKEDFFKVHERDHFEGRVERIDKKNSVLGENATKEHKRLIDTYILLLKQQLQRMNIWLSMAESRMKSAEEIGPAYENVKRQLEEHQGFQEELRDHSMISMILELDITDSTISENVQEQVRSLSDRWGKVWNWSEQRKTLLLKVLSNWQRFRDEQLILLNWLSNKEKLLKEMGRTDLTDEEEVKRHLQNLRGIEKELDEQGIRLQSLHSAGEELLKKVEDGDTAAKEIHTQLQDFDDCWNDIAKQVINKIQQLETSQSKLREFHSEMGVTNEWMDETEKILNSFTVGMDPEEASRIQEKTEIKCEERPKYATKVERVNRIGKDLAGEIDQPSHDIIQEELEPFNARWSDLSTQLEIFSDKGYPQNECCFLRLMRRKFGLIH